MLVCQFRHFPVGPPERPPRTFGSAPPARPAASKGGGRCAGEPPGTRTPNLLIKSQLPLPIELAAHGWKPMPAPNCRVATVRRPTPCPAGQRTPRCRVGGANQFSPIRRTDAVAGTLATALRFVNALTDARSRGSRQPHQTPPTSRGIGFRRPLNLALGPHVVGGCLKEREVRFPRRVEAADGP